MLTHTHRDCSVIKSGVLLSAYSRCQARRWDGLLQLVDLLLQVDICDNSLRATRLFVIYGTGEIVVWSR